MSDLVVAAFLLAASFFLEAGGGRRGFAGRQHWRWTQLDRAIHNPTVAGARVAGRPLPYDARGCSLWRDRDRSFWYVVNLGNRMGWPCLEGYSIDRGPLALIALTVRLGIEFIDLWSLGRDRWLYVIAPRSSRRSASCFCALRRYDLV
jgi:hypothetical protein